MSQLTITEKPPAFTQELRQTLAVVESMPGIDDYEVARRIETRLDVAYWRLSRLRLLGKVKFRDRGFYPVQVGGNGVSEMETDR